MATRKPAAKKVVPVKKAAPAAKKTAATKKAPAAGTLKPSAELAAVIGDGTVSRPEVVKKIWDYIKANNLQDPTDKRSVIADAKLRPVFGKDKVTMFEIAGIVGKHVS